MGTVTLAYPRVRENRITSGMIGTRLTPPFPDALVPPPLPLGAVPEEVDYDVDIVDFSILYRVLWVVGV